MSQHKQLLLPFDLPPLLSPENFCASSSNKEAFTWIQQWRDWPRKSLIVYGPSGCGKTHLGHVWQRHVSASWLTFEQAEQTPPFELVSQNLFWVIDGAHLFKNEIFLLQFYNFIQEQEGWLLLLASTPPARWPLQLPDLRSRLHAVPAVAIAQPDDVLLQRVLRKLFEDQQVHVPEDAVVFLARHMERSFATARVLVEKINQKSLILQHPLTVLFLREIGAHLPSFLG